jgi:hypothetical protein
MKKRIWVMAVAMTMVSGSALAGNIRNLSGQSCGALTGEWHFVNNQTGTTSPGTLQATWDSGDSCTVGPSKITLNTQHFFCTASGALTGASTNLLGRLVLSDFTCETKPPPCDPKKEKCE